MNTKILALAAIIIIIMGCSKDEYETSPGLKFKEVTATVIPLNAYFKITLEVTDKEGDIQDSIFIQKFTRTPNCTAGNQAVAKYKMPDFAGTKNLKAEVDILFVSNNISAANAFYLAPGICGGTRVDTAYFKFWVKDKEKNVSDTVTSPDIILLRS